MNTFLKKRFVACFLHLLYYIAESNSPSTIEVVVSASVTLRFSGSCDGAVEWKYHQKMAQQELLPPTLVAHLDQGTGRLTPGEGFKGRVELGHRDLDLKITSVVYNDNGWYECYCNSIQLPRDVVLVVMASIEKAAHVGENVTFTCHASTGKQTPDSEVHFYWEKDGQTLLNVTAGHFVVDHEFKDRASVSLDGYRRGDLSLNLTDVRLSDQGKYQCSFITATDRWRRRGHPDSWNLTVTPKAKEKQSEAGTFSIYTGVVAALVVIILLGVVFGGKEWFQRICSRFQSGYCPEVGSRPQQETESANVTIPEEHQERPTDPKDDGLPLLMVMPERGVNDPPVHVEQDREHEAEMEEDKSGTGPRVYFSSDSTAVIRAPGGPLSAPGLAPNATD